MKRGRSYGVSKPPKKKRRTSAYIPPRRAYPGSLVPLASRGYRLNKSEKKVADIGTATYNVSTTGVFTLLAVPTLGSDMTNRIGRKIVYKSFYIRGYVLSQPSATNAVASCQASQTRMIIFADLQPNGAAPAVVDLLNTADPTSHLNLNNRDRFKIFCDKTYVFDPYMFSTTATQSYAQASNNIKQIKKFKKINLESIFNGTNGGTIGDITSGALYMFWIGSTANGTIDGNAILSTRVRYIDV